ncbi:MAG: ribonuclease R [Bdellovibrionales bacterium]
MSKIPRQRSAAKNQSLTGIVKRHPDGFGFFVPDDTEAPDVYIPRHEMSGVMANDRVTVRVMREPGGQRFRGEIQQIISRAVKRVTGRYEELGGGQGCLRDHSFAWGADVIVKNPMNLHIKPGDWISVDVVTYPDAGEGLTGKAVAVIGDAANPLNDSIRVLHTHNIPHEFSARALQEAARLPNEVSERDLSGRKDLRNLNFITIDGRTAKDFDDAIYVESSDRGFRLWVAIADVSHYVKPGTGIDQDAYERGTSTYFPNFVAPMLPEKLSNELCSLKPKVPRLSFVSEMQLSFTGDLLDSQFYEAVIESKARVTYGEAQEVIDNNIPKDLAHVAADIKRAGDLAKILMAKRFKEGSLDLEIPETELEIDETGQPVDVLQSERLFAHRLIEELMLMANVAVAKQFTARSVPALYRIHDSPNPDAISNLEKFMATLGSKRQIVGGGLQKKITKALQDFAGHPQEHILNVLTLRSMAQAQYSSENIGHFGLGFQDYAHFTSPIRRYPDLIVHRQMKALLKIRGYEMISGDDLGSTGAFLSACEQRSAKAERQIKAIKKARFMQKQLGNEFEGMVSSVTKFGLFVILRQFDVDGLVRLETLPGDRFEFDEKNMRLVGRRSGHVIKIGDPFTVTVAAVNVDEGRIDFVPAGVKVELATKEPQNKGRERVDHSQSKNKPSEKRRPAKNNNKRFRSKRVPPGRRRG